MRQRQGFREAFRKPTILLVKLTPKGFLIEDEIHPELTGRVVKTRLVRKRFEDRVLVCSSLDGIRARDGSVCDECRHPGCQPQLRAHLVQGEAIYILDLAASSARNLFAAEDEAAANGEQLRDWTLRLSMRNRGHWGEVCFQRV